MTRQTTSYTLDPHVIELVARHADAAGVSRSRWVERTILVALSEIPATPTTEPGTGTTRRRWLRRR